MNTYKVWVNAKGFVFRGYIEARSLAHCFELLNEAFPGHVSKTVVIL